MQKMFFGLACVAALLIAGAAMATHSVQHNITCTIDNGSYIAFTTPAPSITIVPSDFNVTGYLASGSTTAGIEYGANFGATVTATLALNSTTPPPGIWTINFYGNTIAAGTLTDSIIATPGTVNAVATIDIGVTGIGLDVPAQTGIAVGTLTVTITATPAPLVVNIS